MMKIDEMMKIPIIGLPARIHVDRLKKYCRHEIRILGASVLFPYHCFSHSLQHASLLHTCVCIQQGRSHRNTRGPEKDDYVIS